jgi:hypothetical protein
VTGSGRERAVLARRSGTSVAQLRRSRATCEPVGSGVVIANQGDGWWIGPDSVACEVCWDRPGRVPGLPGLYWLLCPSSRMHDPGVIASFHCVLVMHSGHDLSAGSAFEDWGIPMHPVLRRVEPGEQVSFDGEVLPGVKAGIRRSG